jgi:hypothetical protein
MVRFAAASTGRRSRRHPPSIHQTNSSSQQTSQRLDASRQRASAELFSAGEARLPRDNQGETAHCVV